MQSKDFIKQTNQQQQKNPTTGIQPYRLAQEMLNKILQAEVK